MAYGEQGNSTDLYDKMLFHFQFNPTFTTLLPRLDSEYLKIKTEVKRR